MSQESKNAALNLYGILDNELARMHALMHLHISQRSNDTHRMMAHTSYGVGSGSHLHYDIDSLYARIVQIQDLLLQAVIATDKELQERIAELALMGKEGEPK